MATELKAVGEFGVQCLFVSDTQAQERKLRAGTENLTGIVGMTTALKNNMRMMEANTVHLEKLSSVFLQHLALSGYRSIPHSETFSMVFVQPPAGGRT